MIVLNLLHNVTNLSKHLQLFTVIYETVNRIPWNPIHRGHIFYFGNKLLRKKYKTKKVKVDQRTRKSM